MTVLNQDVEIMVYILRLDMKRTWLQYNSDSPHPYQNKMRINSYEETSVPVL